AKGEAEALEVKAKALRENSQILQQMAIEKWDGKLPQYMGSSSVPFVQIK
ncbi:prohibitin family protein, partial [Burkholderia pseudomallei]|nr:prohibitin family protein [Burkholderia pseudomallei]MBF3478895.1 prohibitin family protein [Burkholderia pseudomallei]MBF3510297.1 prohibitin family protein [Burkholderia pseudomallei]MBF3515405.1 prohibitin family protein [Burkholderia pseudomallei]MBF3583419.1 prohibitin family protein [Burkholderia pseudomallei]